MNPSQLENIIEAALLVAARPMTIAQLEALFEHDDEKPERDAIKEALDSLRTRYEGRGIELTEVASGWRLQSRAEMSPWISNLFQEKSPRYSRALLETLVLVAYRQPITRGEIEDVRGVAVSTNIIKTLLERDWVKVVGHRDVPGRPALYATTKQFLDYFNLKKIGDLPTLSEIKELHEIAPDLAKEVAMLENEVAAEGEGGDDESSGSPGDDGSGMGGSGEQNHDDQDSGDQDPDTGDLGAEGDSGTSLNDADSGSESSSNEGSSALPEEDAELIAADSRQTDQGDGIELAEDEVLSDSPDIDVDVDLSVAEEEDFPDVRDATIDALSSERRDTETLH